MPLEGCPSPPSQGPAARPGPGPSPGQSSFTSASSPPLGTSLPCLTHVQASQSPGYASVTRDQRPPGVGPRSSEEQ